MWELCTACWRRDWLSCRLCSGPIQFADVPQPSRLKSGEAVFSSFACAFDRYKPSITPSLWTDLRADSNTVVGMLSLLWSPPSDDSGRRSATPIAAKKWRAHFLEPWFLYGSLYTNCVCDALDEPAIRLKHCSQLARPAVVSAVQELDRSTATTIAAKKWRGHV